MCIGIVTLFMLIVVPIRDVVVEAEQNTQIEIEIYGGFGITVVVKNLGEEDLSNLDWKIDLSGLIFIVGVSQGIIISLPAESEVTLRLFFLGIGPGAIGVTVGDAYKVADFFIVGPFVIME